MQMGVISEAQVHTLEVVSVGGFIGFFEIQKPWCFMVFLRFANFW